MCNIMALFRETESMSDDSFKHWSIVFNKHKNTDQPYSQNYPHKTVDYRHTDKYQKPVTVRVQWERQADGQILSSELSPGFMMLQSR